MNTLTTRKLLIPLLGLSTLIIVVLGVTKKLDWPSILTNIISELIGIIITVFYIEKILSDHERARWQPVQSGIDRKVNRFAFDAIRDLLDALNLRHKIKVVKSSVSPIDIEFDSELLDRSLWSPMGSNEEDIYIKALSAKFPGEENINRIRDHIDEGYRIIDLFREQFTPDLYMRLIIALEKLERLGDDLDYILLYFQQIDGSSEINISKESLATSFYDAMRVLVELFKLTVYTRRINFRL